MRTFIERIKRLAETTRGASLVLLFFVALTLLAIAAQTALAIRQDKALTLSSEREHGLTAVRLLEEHAKQILNEAAGNIDALARAIEVAREGKPANDALIRKVLADAQPLNRILTSFQYVNLHGVASVSTIDYPAYQTDADDRTYIPLLLSHPDQREPVLGRPFARFYDGELILPLARSFTSSDGQPLGLLSTDVSVSYFSKFYVPLARDGNALVALVSDDGHLIVRAPQQGDEVGADISSSPIQQRLRQPQREGQFEDAGLLGGGVAAPRLYFYKKVAGFPVTAIYARELDDVLAPWQIRSRDRIVFSLAIMVFVGLLSFFLLWHIRRLNKSRTELSRSEARFGSVFLHSPVPLSLVRLSDDRIVAANEAMLALFRYRREDFVGRTPAELKVWADYADRQPYLERITADGHLSQYPARMRNRDGQLMHCMVSVQVFEGEEGRIAIFSAIDETQQREAEARLRQLEQQLREAQKMEAIGTLAGGIAHDFNNILAAILGNVGMARQDVPVDHGARSFLDEINKAALRARSLVQQILAFSRRQPHQMLVQPLRPIVEESLSLLRATLPARVALDLDLSEEALSLETDATQLQQVLMNLCTNGWHALSGSTGRLSVGYGRLRLDHPADPRLTRLPSGDYVHLWVGDNGVGMSEELQARVFEPFFTTKPVGQGTGLGLAVVHGIVTAHRGAITVDSKLGAGTTFHLYLPLADAVATGQDPLSPQSLQDGQGQGHVLYLDDDEVMLLMVERLLKRCGYEVSCYQQASEALAALAEPGCDVRLFITDFNMPDMSGLEVAKAAAELRPGLPLIITSGYINDELLAGAEALGACAVLQKQNTLDELPGLVRRCLQPP
ncbi:response regulator [Pelomonas sp. V22]|uniref:ATP-binding protein n=1 Tax=Pelomonas sp. V22 TaxID=2822139 RepID=UPI0024A940EE|nr:ATP-binding protein [Pelomonas sp. V22]MDI4632089.1 response regulator [Pelomonas sp. V22]